MTQLDLLNTILASVHDLSRKVDAAAFSDRDRWEAHYKDHSESMRTMTAALTDPQSSVVGRFLLAEDLARAGSAFEAHTKLTDAVVALDERLDAIEMRAKVRGEFVRAIKLTRGVVASIVASVGALVTLTLWISSLIDKMPTR